jgi:hypothetical protein
VFYDVKQKLEKLLDIKSVEDLPGNQPFSTAKRFLRQTAPALWEETERAEAEVRMIGALFLSAWFNLILSMITVRFHFNAEAAWYWFIMSLGVLLFLGEGYRYALEHEVEYMYINTLIAIGCRSWEKTESPLLQNAANATGTAGKQNDSKEEDE